MSRNQCLQFWGLISKRRILFSKQGYKRSLNPQGIFIEFKFNQVVKTISFCIVEKILEPVLSSDLKK